jgi:phage pi2 protein 07
MGNEKTKLNNITQYFSKWRKCWVFFSDGKGNKYPPNESELKEFIKYKYKLR